MKQGDLILSETKEDQLAGRETIMRQIRGVLRLGLKQHQIARSCSIVQGTVHKYLKQARAAGLAWHSAEWRDTAILWKR